MPGCIAFNLVLGNAILYALHLHASGGGETNWRLVIGASLACVACYWFLFTKIPFWRWRVVWVCLISVATCLAIVFIGGMLTMSLFSASYGEEGAIGVLAALLSALVAGLAGMIICSHIAVGMGLANLFWLLLYRKYARTGDTNEKCD